MIASQKVVSKHIARIPVLGTIIASFAVNMCTRKNTNKLHPVEQLLYSKKRIVPLTAISVIWFEILSAWVFTCSHEMYSYMTTGIE